MLMYLFCPSVLEENSIRTSPSTQRLAHADSLKGNGNWVHDVFWTPILEAWSQKKKLMLLDSKSDELGDTGNLKDILNLKQDCVRD